MGFKLAHKCNYCGKTKQKRRIYGANLEIGTICKDCYKKMMSCPRCGDELVPFETVVETERKPPLTCRRCGWYTTTINR